MIVHDLDSVVSHLEAVPLADAQEEAVKVVVYLRTAASFDVHQGHDAIRLALQPSSPSPTAARAPATCGRLRLRRCHRDLWPQARWRQRRH